MKEKIRTILNKKIEQSCYNDGSDFDGAIDKLISLFAQEREYIWEEIEKIFQKYQIELIEKFGIEEDSDEGWFLAVIKDLTSEVEKIVKGNK